MLSKAVSYIDKEDILVPEKYLMIEPEFIDLQVDRKMDQVLRQYFPQSSQLTDDLVRSLAWPAIHSLEDLRMYFVQQMQQTSYEYVFYQQLLPYLLAFYSETTQTIINQEEFDQFLHRYEDKLAAYADEEGVCLADYLHHYLHLKGEVEDVIEARAQEDFVFSLIAQDRYPLLAEGDLYDEYQAYLFERSTLLQADPTELSGQIPFSTFEVDYSILRLTQELFAFYLPKFKFA